MWLIGLWKYHQLVINVHRGGSFSVKIPSYQYRDCHYKASVVSTTLIFMIGIIIPGKTVFMLNDLCVPIWVVCIVTQSNPQYHSSCQADSDNASGRLSAPPIFSLGLMIICDSMTGTISIVPCSGRGSNQDRYILRCTRITLVLLQGARKEFPWNSHHVEGLVQGRRNTSALALELRLSCTDPSILGPFSTRHW